MLEEQAYEVVVLGGGIVGAASAEVLARRGRRVALLDRFAAGHEHGSSHGDGRILRLSYPERVYVEMARRAYPAWKRLEDRGGQKLVERTGSWDCGRDGSPELEELASCLANARIPYQRWSARESRERFPQLILPRGSSAIYQPEGAIVRASRAVRQLWGLAERSGAVLCPQTRIVAIDPTGDRVRLDAEDGSSWSCEVLLLAAGSWSKRLLDALGLALPLTVSEELVAYFPPRAAVDHRVGALPTVIDYHHDHPFYALPQIDVPGVKVGWHRTGRNIDPDRRPPHPDAWSEQHLEALGAFVAERFPELTPTPIHTNTCLYTNTPDYHFVLDRHPSFAKVILATGFSGHGFKFAPVLGEILAALALDERPPLPIDTFELARFASPEALGKRTGA